MNYIVFDLEYNQAFDFPHGEKMEIDIKCPFEIIQIGAVMLDDNFKKIREQSFFIKPKIYTRMHPFVQKLTGISITDLANEKGFEEVYYDFISFIGSGKSILCTWGTNDVKELFRNVLYYKLNDKVLTRKHINVQQIATKHFKQFPNNSIGLKSAVEAFGLDNNLDFHDALNDAIYTARILRKVKNETLQIQTFNLSTLRQRNLAKESLVNTGLLFNYAEKLFNKRLTDKEKEGILSIYNAGNKNNFSV